MFKNLLLTFFFIFGSFIAIYPSKKEKTNLFDYCYPFEKILSRNTLEKNKNVSQKYKTFAKDFALFGANKTKGALVNKIINQYKNTQNTYITNLVPNQFYCLAGYWIEKVKPGTFESIFYEKSKQKINEYKNTKKQVDEFIKDINSEYKSIEKEIYNFF
ncbi:hypothetical protein EU99_1636 [Prochlorococcus marinus str. MIT 9321]|uniref:Carbon storage regulator CsrA n=1 Tax=Prochlorococcus marinus str. MIT 9401 TaxID=167551 RepID=A0A0A2BC56_PROMR|nr:hypothetical protein [Prochlorococcus marinus]KGG02674.1 hypothetical protein EU99_1636 [Prochlorococcus marinus str. MIT 9321]KGG05309.1 hypothetical protein EV00_0942 [Prochlorococcus marinus str. MIT 9322]KGG10370.1 hypothetical protein EV01_0273 [Prochlorococcus marinus str. MIT 9401]